MVHRDNIVKQAEKNFCQYDHEKYLFNRKKIVFNGKEIKIRKANTFSDTTTNDINIFFRSTQGLNSELNKEGENILTKDDFVNNDVVIIADEAHSLNVATKNKDKTKSKDEINWEDTIKEIINVDKVKTGDKEIKKNILIEFTATVDLANANINEKYKDKLLYKYDFSIFNKEGYCKDVQFLYNNETEVEDQKKYLIVNAVVLSQYRKLLFRDKMKEEVNPVILIKSTKIAKSAEDRDFFNTVVSNLKVSDLNKLKNIKSGNSNHVENAIGKMFDFLKTNNYSLEKFVSSIRQDFATQHTLIYNSEKKERSDELANLDNPRNTIRAIFSVNALNEGWDVLCLYDIIHFDISEDKKVSLQDIQLIGRGARYRPFSLSEKDYSEDENLFGKSYDFIKDKRKFDKARDEDVRMLETFFYHFVKTGLFLDNLRTELIEGGIMNEQIIRKTITMKDSFLGSETYKNGFILINRTEKRQKTTQEEIDKTFKKIIKAGHYQLMGSGLTDADQNISESNKSNTEIKILDYFDKIIIYKALVKAEGNTFFRFSNLSKHLIDIQSIDDFIDKYLPFYTIKYFYEKGKEIVNLDNDEKLRLLVNVILPEIRKKIDMGLPLKVGSPEFRPVSVKTIFPDKQKDIYVPVIQKATTDKLDPSKEPENAHGEVSDGERAIPQSEHHKADLRLNIQEKDWYIYDENYGTNEEKRFVFFVNNQMQKLREKYIGSEIFLIRNELDYWLFGLEDGRRFSPDFLLMINDVKNKTLYYQCIIEVKGGHLLQKDEWKEKALLDLDANSKISFLDPNKLEMIDDMYLKNHRDYNTYLASIKNRNIKNIKSLGFSFYNTDTEERKFNFEMEFKNKLDIN